MPDFDLSVYLVTDTPLSGVRGVAETARLAAEGGATIVQLRDPDGSTRSLVDTAATLMAVLKPRGIPLIVNDRVDVALAAGADGVHLGQSDMPAGIARRLIGPDRILGLSVANRAELAASQDDMPHVDYIGVGPFRPTTTKPDAGAAIGAAGLTAMGELVSVPIVAIGGIDANNAGDAIRAGADGVAVVSAICAADDPVAATRELVDTVAEARRNRARP